MKNKILLVAKKEWHRFFGDRRMVISALVFPCIFLYIVYSFLVPYIIQVSAENETTLPVSQMVIEQNETDFNLFLETENIETKEEIKEGAYERYLLAMVLPIFLVVFIFHGSMAVTTEAITGEKERGTLATIFLTSITPLELSAGKILGLGIESFLCGISAAIGMTLSLPRLIDSFTKVFATSGEISSSRIGITQIFQYNIGEIGLLFFILLTTSCFVVTLVSIISINAKTAKEAQMLIYPLIIVFLFISFLSTMQSSSGVKQIYHYLIPVYNSVLIMSDIINLNRSFLNAAATVAANLFLVALGCVALSKLLNTEKIVGT